MNDSRFGGPYFHTEETCDSTAKLLPQDQKTICVLNSFTIVPEELPEYILVGARMSTKCCRFQEMPEFCFVSGGKIYVSYFTPICFSSLIFFFEKIWWHLYYKGGTSVIFLWCVWEEIQGGFVVLPCCYVDTLPIPSQMLARVTPIPTVYAPPHLVAVRDTPSSDNPSSIPTLDPPTYENHEGSKLCGRQQRGNIDQLCVP